MIFTREVSDPLASLVKKLDAEIANVGKRKLCSYVVYLSDEEDAEQRLKQLAESNGIKNVSLTVMEPPGPRRYKVAKDAAVTVVLYKRQRVVANHAFAPGQFTAECVEKVLSDLPKIQ